MSLNITRPVTKVSIWYKKEFFRLNRKGESENECIHRDMVTGMVV